MYIKSVSYDNRNSNFFDEFTIVVDNVTPYQKERLLSFYNAACDFYVTATGPRAHMLRFFGSSNADIKVTKVIYHNPATIVFWSDGTKTVVKCDKNDTYDPEKGFYIACAKKLFGNNYKAVGRINKALEMAEDKND